MAVNINIYAHSDSSSSPETVHNFVCDQVNVLIVIVSMCCLTKINYYDHHQLLLTTNSLVNVS